MSLAKGKNPGLGLEFYQQAKIRSISRIVNGIAILKMAKHNPDLPLPVGKASAVNIRLQTY
jgi:hypothetical protein